MVSGLIASLALATQAEITPPTLVKRDWPDQSIPKEGKAITIKEDDGECTLYLPASWAPKAEETLTLHFHTTAWLPVREHLAAGLNNPLLVWNRPGASSAYRVPFEDKDRWPRLLAQVKTELITNGAPKDFDFTAYKVSSFSAGYGAVRELVKRPDFFSKLKRVVLCDSIYGSLDESDGTRKARQDTVEPWFPLAEAAAKGEKTFLLTFSEVPTPYASSSECGAAIAAHVGGKFQPANPEPPVRSEDNNLKPLTRYDKGNLHLWLYPGHDGVAHIIHVHNLAQLWKSLDQAQKP